MGLTIGPSTSHPSYQDYPGDKELCSAVGGGYLICKTGGGVGWIVSPYSAEVSRTWYCINDANITAQAVSGRSGWFVPTLSQLSSPGYACRSFWGPSPCYSACVYRTSTIHTDPAFSRAVNFTNGVQTYDGGVNAVCCTRSFRCVCY